MATAEQQLKDAGAAILREMRLRQPRFLFEVELPNWSPESVFRLLPSAGRENWRPEYKAAAAWAAVQLASRSESGDVQDESGFRGLFFKEIRREFSVDEWENTFGLYIRQFLEKEFPSVKLPQPGRWHLVGAVYRHAGIPSTLKDNYARFVAKLLRGEWSFAFDEYHRRLSILPSNVARQFLESRAGFEFTRDLARQVARVYRGDLDDPGLPEWSSKLIDSVVRLLREDRADPNTLHVPNSFAKPHLGLDPETYSLKVFFDPRGVREKYYWEGPRSVLYHPRLVKSPRVPEFRSGSDCPFEPVDPWWTPASGGWALFRVGDGALVTCVSPVSPGDYYLVTDNPSAVPEPLIQEDDAPLDSYAIEGGFWEYSVVRVALIAGAAIPALDLRVEGEIPRPQLEWIRPERTNWGPSIFHEQIPSFRVKPWNASLSLEYSLTLEDGTSETELLVPNNGEIPALPSRCPMAGCLVLKRRSIASQVANRLIFGVIPAAWQLLAPREVLRIGDSAQVQVHLPPGVSVDWSPSLRQDGPGVYAIGPHERRLEGILRFRDCAVNFSVRLPRVEVVIEIDGQSQPVLWQEFCDRNATIRMELPAGTASKLFVAGEGSLFPLLDQPKHARDWLQRVPIADFRDALLTCQYPVGELVLRLRTWNKDLPDIQTGVYFASAKRLISVFMSLPINSRVFAIPKLGPLLLKYRSLVDRPESGPLPNADGSSPKALESYLKNLRALASALDVDSGYGITASSDDSPYASGLAVLPWLREALTIARRGGDASEIQTPYPLGEIENLPIQRWISQIYRLYDQLTQNSALPSLIREFKNSFRPGGGPDRVTLCERSGGIDLWHGVNSYRLSLQDGRPAERDLVRQLIRFDAIVSNLDADPVVRMLAVGFQFLNYYRLDRKDMLTVERFSAWPYLLSPFRTTLVALAAKSTGNGFRTEWPQFGIGLTEISPADQDAELELAAGRPLTKMCAI